MRLPEEGRCGLFNRAHCPFAAQLAVTLGILLVYLCGLHVFGLGWRSLCGVAAAPLAALLVGCLFFLPESPRWLCARGRKEEAAAALRLLRGREDVATELHDIQTAALEAAAQPAPALTDFFRRRSLAAPLGISCALMVFQQFSGINAGEIPFQFLRLSFSNTQAARI